MRAKSTLGGRLVWFCSAVVSMTAVSQVQAAITLPAPGNGLSLQNGDFQVYSLPFLDNLFGGFSVDSTPGQIKDGIVIFTGANGNPVTTNFAGMDNAFETPSGAGDPNYFLMGDPAVAKFADPSGGPTSGTDFANRWDADVSAVRSFLSQQGGGDLVLFFNLNDTNGRGTALDFSQDQLGWAQFDLIDADGILPTRTFYLSSQDDRFGVSTPTDELAAGLAASALGAPNPNTTSNPDGTANQGAGDTDTDIDPQWTYIHGIITVDASNNFLHFGPVQPTDPAGASTINQNLGADEAAFAIFNQELSDLINDPLSGYETLSIDARLSRINNGYEQLFILPMVNVTRNPPGVVPEAASLTTWAVLGLIGAGARRRR